MGYAIDIHRFAPKCRDLGRLGQLNNSHSVAFDKCNFRCRYCELRNRPRTNFVTYSPERFREVAEELFRLGKGFKFTGGEPTLNPTLLQDLAIVKELGGLVYLDTNGSRPSVIRDALDRGLVDVLGLSLKGLDEKTCMETAQVARPGPVWDHVLESLDIACAHPGTTTIVTLVVDRDSASKDTLLSLAALLDGYPGVLMKINNIMENPESLRFGLHPADPALLVRLVSDFVDKNPRWKGRCILITSDKAVGSYDDILFY